VTLGRRYRTPTVLQLEAAECGAASLAMVLAFHGRLVPLDVLRALCGVSRDGAKASSLLRAARTFGLEAKGLKAEPEHLADLDLPLIAFVNFNHFVVVERVSDKYVWINDPAFGRRRETAEEFEQGFTGVVLIFAPTSDFVTADTRPSLASSVLGRFAGVRTALFYVLLTSLALVVPGIVLPVFSRIFVDDILVRHIDDWLTPLLIAMAATAAARFLLLHLQQEALLRARQRMTLDSGGQLFAKLMTLPIAFFDSRFAGEIADRMRLNEDLVEMLTGQVATVAAGLVTAIFFLALMMLYSVPLTLGVLALVVAELALVVLSGRALSARYRKISIEHGKLAGARIAGVKDIETFKASGAEDMLLARWLGLSVNIENGRQAVARASAWLGSLPRLTSTLTTALVLIGGGALVMRGEFTLGELVAYQTLAASFGMPLAQLASFAMTLQQVRSYTGRLDDILDQEPDPRFAAGEPPPLQAMPRGGIVLDEIVFGYAPLDPPLIDGLSLELRPGSRIALVGASGSGKSTLGKLIAGLEQPREGGIAIDGRPHVDWPREALAARLAYVRQDVVLFEGSVRDNLTLWDETIADSDLVAAARDAQIHEVIASRPGAYDSPVGEGAANFSGGERQRLEIARALATNPSVIVLDEATSALDPVTELKVMEAIRRRGATCIVIAHRLSAIRDCDEILVMEQGIPVERGTHAFLMKTGGAYAQLVEA
jgi:NHLM bacteriocin system ABC transporter peptidase/ATP-binding protein